MIFYKKTEKYINGGGVLGKLNSLRDSASKKLKVSSDILAGVPLITQIGNKKVIVENYKSILGILEYEVKVSTSLGTLKVFGQKMKMIEMTSDTLIIIGKIEKIELL